MIEGIFNLNWIKFTPDAEGSHRLRGKPTTPTTTDNSSRNTSSASLKSDAYPQGST